MKGKKGEDQACGYLEEKGCKILKRNFRSSLGEVDIIGVTQERLHFVEVKTWDALGFETMENAIGAVKIKKILHAAKYFLSKNPQYGDYNMGFDLIFISQGGQKLVHLPNAFNETGYS